MDFEWIQGFLKQTVIVLLIMGVVVPLIIICLMFALMPFILALIADWRWLFLYIGYALALILSRFTTVNDRHKGGKQE